MTDDDARALYVGFLELMRQHGLEWIAEQIENEVSLGRPDTKQVDQMPAAPERLSAVEAVGPPVPRRRRTTRKVEFPATVEYTAQERVRIALEALRNGSVLPVEIAHELVAFAEREIGAGRILFARPVEGAEPDTIVDRPLVDQRREASKSLQASLDAVAREL